MRLKEYQRIGVCRLLHHTPVLLGDDMGLGKTVQAITAARAYRLACDKSPTIVVICPASVKYNWVKEFSRWWPAADVEVLKGRKPKTLISRHVYIINWEVLQYWAEELHDLLDRVVILDEAHYAKNYKAKRTKAAQIVTQGAKRVWLLTGTPVLSRPYDLYGLTLVSHRPEFGAWHDYVTQYCEGKQEWVAGRKVWYTGGASNLDELRQKMDTYLHYIARKRTDVLDNLPAHGRSLVALEVSQRHKKKIHKQEAADGILDDHIMRYYRILGLAKVKAVVKWIRDLSETTEIKMVLFAHHRDVQQVLYEQLRKHFKVLLGKGGLSAEEKQELVDRFTEGNAEIFIASLGAFSTGVNLQAAQQAVFAELTWLPAVMEQAEARISRIGQTRETQAYWLVDLNDRFDQAALFLLAEKGHTIELLTGDEAWYREIQQVKADPEVVSVIEQLRSRN